MRFISMLTFRYGTQDGELGVLESDGTMNQEADESIEEDGEGKPERRDGGPQPVLLRVALHHVITEPFDEGQQC